MLFLLRFRAQDMIQLVAKDNEEAGGSNLKTIVSFFFKKIQQNSF